MLRITPAAPAFSRLDRLLPFGAGAEGGPVLRLLASCVARGALGPGRHLLGDGTWLIKTKFWKEFKIYNSSLLLLNKVLTGLTLQFLCLEALDW